LVSYAGLAMELLSVVEKELKIIINTVERAEKKLMWRDIYLYLERNPIIDSEHEWSDFLIDFNKMNYLRNMAAHGEDITEEEYLNVKRFVISGPILEWISEYKGLNNIN
jgi:hypothetical protein